MSLIELILAVSMVVMVGVVAFSVRAFLPRWRKLVNVANHQHKQLQQINEQVQQLASSNIGVGNQLERMKVDIEVAKEQADQALMVQQRNAVPYQQARHMASTGTDVDGLVETCGLTLAEAELLLKLQGDAGTEGDVSLAMHRNSQECA